jgi:hypothetical protein
MGAPQVEAVGVLIGDNVVDQIPDGSTPHLVFAKEGLIFAWARWELRHVPQQPGGGGRQEVVVAEMLHERQSHQRILNCLPNHSIASSSGSYGSPSKAL